MKCNSIKLIYKVILLLFQRLNSALIYDRDFSYQYFGFKTLERSYLLRINGKVAERPQHMLMRVAVGIHHEDIDGAIEVHIMLTLDVIHCDMILYLRCNL